MRYILFLFLLFSIGCYSVESRYDPVDWNSKLEPESESEFVESETEQISATLQALLKLHNEQRELKGRPSLQLDLYLCQYAQKHSDWMASKNRLEHSKISVLIGKYSTVGENIAWNQQSEIEVVDAWMHSSGHRANIMNRAFTKVGFGLSYKNEEPYWCTCFGN
jgi:uncharacterized protein YkwD